MHIYAIQLKESNRLVALFTLTALKTRLDMTTAQVESCFQVGYFTVGAVQVNFEDAYGRQDIYLNRSTLQD